MEKDLYPRLCRFCIWFKQCEEKKPCSFYDDGRGEIDLSDRKFYLKLEFKKAEYRKKYWEYLRGQEDEKSFKRCR